MQVDLAVPADIRGTSPAEKMVRATFAFDARKALGGRRLSGTYQTYLLAGRVVAGPYPLSVGTP